jgi:acetolactate synthase-1/2/3 large subunit
MQQLLSHLKPLQHGEWLEQIGKWQNDTQMRNVLHRKTNGELLAAHVIYLIWQATKGDAVVVSDVGQHQMWEAQYYAHQRPHTLITSGGLGTMGFAVPAAIGAKMGVPDEDVWVIVGDGGFQMTCQELMTAVQENVKINIAIINNGYLGMVRQWQEFFYEERYNATPMMNPDFSKLAEAYGIPAMRVTERDEVTKSVEWAESIDGPVVIDYQVEQHDIVYPMVPAGADLDKMIRRPYPEAEEVKSQ